MSGFVNRLAGGGRRTRARLRALRPVAAVTAVVLASTGAAALALAQPAAGVAGCRVSYTLASSWRGGFTANLSITDLGAPIAGWTLAFALPGDEAISQNWNADYSQSGRNVTASSAWYNTDLRTGVATPIGFNVAYAYTGGPFPGNPTSFTLNGALCTTTVSVSPAPTAGAATPSPGSASGGPGSSGAPSLPYQSSDRFAQIRVGGYAFSNDEWGDGYGTQTLSVNSATSWGVSADQPDTPNVKSYANVSKDVGIRIDSLSSATSTFDESNPDGGSWESAYDLWLNGTGIEVMAWTYVSGGVRPLGQSVSTVTLDGNTWTLYVGDNGHNPTYSFVRHGDETSGKVDILGLLKYLEKTGGYFSDPVLSSIQYGWEITGTGGVRRNFAMHGFTADVS